MHLHRAEILLGETSEEHALGQLYWGLDRANFNAMRIGEALAASQKAMEIFTRLGDRESWAESASNHAESLMVKGKIAQAVALSDQIMEAAPSFTDPVVFGHVICSSVWFRMLMRHPREALRIYRLGLKRSGIMPDVKRSLLEYVTLCEALVGNLTEAKRLAAENYTNPTFQMQVAYHDGDWKTAQEALEKALDWLRAVNFKWLEVNTLSHAVDLRRAAGDYPGATNAFERTFSFYAPDDLFLEARVRHQGVMLYFDIGQTDKAFEHRQYCHKILSGQEDWLGRAGPLWRAEAIGAALQDRFEESERYFEKSKEICRWYSLPWEEAETMHYWGKVLIQVGRPDRAREKLDAADKIYRDYGAGQAWIDRVEADRRRAQPSSADPPQGRHADAETASREAIFRNEGEFWTMSYLNHTFRLKDMRGLHYLAYLLARPNERFHVRELSAVVGGDALSPAASDPSLHPDREDAPPILDNKAKADYRARLSELHAELDEAERINDTGRAERIRQELEFVNDELSAAIGLGGRDRKMSDPAERRRLRIGKAIRSAVAGIREHDPRSPITSRPAFAPATTVPTFPTRAS
jgi:tetratricopeptide (TPR) repeat protein